jgi:hypothetical protein
MSSVLASDDSATLTEGPRASYVVLQLVTTEEHDEATQRDGVTQSWRDIGSVPARSAEAAIREVLAGDSEGSGTYVAIPARSWKPVTVRAETTTTLRIEEAT